MINLRVSAAATPQRNECRISQSSLTVSNHRFLSQQRAWQGAFNCDRTAKHADEDLSMGDPSKNSTWNLWPGDLVREGTRDPSPHCCVPKTGHRFALKIFGGSVFGPQVPAACIADLKGGSSATGRSCCNPCRSNDRKRLASGPQNFHALCVFCDLFLVQKRTS